MDSLQDQDGLYEGSTSIGFEMSVTPVGIGQADAVHVTQRSKYDRDRSAPIARAAIVESNLGGLSIPLRPDGIGSAKTDSQEPLDHRIDLVSHFDGAEMSRQHRLGGDELRAQFLQTI